MGKLGAATGDPTAVMVNLGAMQGVGKVVSCGVSVG
jgi:hypothetical protein